MLRGLSQNRAYARHILKILSLSVAQSLAGFPFFTRARRPSPVSVYLRPSTWALEPDATTFAPDGRWSNKDMDPVSPEGKPWSTYNYIAYWIYDAANHVNWELTSNIYRLGVYAYQMLKAICPTIQHLPNYLLANANITSSGACEMSLH
ncbi:hypothetical protein PHLGIDRAFT_230086 [Phlebiopsis gigantea 11061_1 CR5-6]|uniref:Uncharacterized protein n=1 Tax=Phlebiopsis gigantea (strain 11061_1 CR5-6) TaxID=745531 RepID=A0A0C3NYD4_PHLG1|nr:hypothetical protein PHLGIDRAFT_230086 [Phlebiopsis gigantea 11061_1 CR5-6]